MTTSVIIPTFNRAALLDRCLVSLSSANIPGLEVIVVDDGGVDDSEAVCKAHPGVRYVKQKNAGVSAARNHGWRLSAGRYIAFIDSDDEWINGGVKRLTEQFEANPDVGVLFGDSLMGSPEHGFESFVQTYGGDPFFALAHEARGGARILERRPFLIQLSTRNVMFLGSMLFRREVFEALGGFDEKLSGAADWDIFMRATAATKVGYSDGPALSRYYKHDAGMSTLTDHMQEDFIKALDSLRRRGTLDAAERQHVDQRIKDHVFGWAYQAYDAGDVGTMRKRLGWARELGQMGVREAAYLFASYLPSTALTAMRRARHATRL